MDDTTYRIKPLVWEKSKSGPTEYSARVMNILVFYVTRIAATRSWEFVVYAGRDARDLESHKTLNSAKNAAENWYRERLERSLAPVSLSPATQTSEVRE